MNNINAIRKQKKLTLNELAKKTNISIGYLCHLEKGSRKNPSYKTNPGNSTTDNVFLLSISEANRYLEWTRSFKCAPTPYALAQGGITGKVMDDYMVDGKATCEWWLRSPGSESKEAAYVWFDGKVHESGANVSVFLAVRPAVWVKLGT